MVLKTLEDYFYAYQSSYKKVFHEARMEYLRFSHLVENTAELSMMFENYMLIRPWIPFKRLNKMTVILTNNNNNVVPTTYHLNSQLLDETAVEFLTFKPNGADEIYIREFERGFSLYCEKIISLSIDCAFDVPPSTLNYVKPFVFPKLESLSLGSSQTESKQFPSPLFYHLTGLKTLKLRKMPLNTSASLIAPNVSHLELYDMPLTSIPIEWVNLRHLKKLVLTQCKLHTFPNDVFAGMKALEELTIQNFSIYPAQLEGSDFTDEPGIQIDTSLRRLRYLSIQHIPMKVVQFVSFHGENFDALKYVHLSNYAAKAFDADNVLNSHLRVTIMHSTSPNQPLIESNARRVAEMFPVLHTFTAEDVFSPTNDESVYKSAFVVPQFLALPSVQILSFATDHPQLHPDSAILDNNVIVEHRLQRYLGENTNEQALKLYNKLLGRYVPPQKKIISTEILLVGRTSPFFIQWKSSLTCNEEIVDPFDGNTKCIICRMEFDETDRMHHEEEGEIKTALFPKKEHLEVAANSPDGQLGCVVVCNFTKNDFMENRMKNNQQRIADKLSPLPTLNPQEQEKYIEKMNCTHHQHFAHRVCYSLHLYSQKERQKFDCPQSRILFLKDVENTNV